MSGYDRHDFYCIKCGNKGIPVQRRINHKHGKHHRKKLWCPYCKLFINHVECRNDEEIEEFKNNWEAGLYDEEVKESLIESNKDIFSMV